MSEGWLKSWIEMSAAT